MVTIRFGCRAGIIATLFVSTILNSLISSGQGKIIKSDYYENHVPVNPSVNSFGEFGNTKINYYTGLPEVSFDLMSLSGREMSVPVSLQYDATGVRTDDLSGNVGLKWNLSAGGYILRELTNLPDEHPDKGYWRHARETDYYTQIKPSDWVQWNERNEKDCAPDEFHLNVKGRSIRFVFDKNKRPHVIPHQYIKIDYTVSESTNADEVRINKFIVTIEDGVKYVFGGVPEAIEERKIETLTIGTSFNFTSVTDCPVIDANSVASPGDFNFDCNYGLKQDFSVHTSLKKNTIPFFNYKWNLTAIILPSNESISFAYQKLNDVKYCVKPSSIRIRPVRTGAALYEIKKEECVSEIFGVCTEKKMFSYHYYRIPVVRKFKNTWPGSGVLNNWEPEGEDGFNPINFSVTPGATNFYHSLITESNTKLLEMKSAIGNRIVFTTSSRDDLPNGIKYDLIRLYNMSNELIRSIKLNYSVHNADGFNDLFWFSEALLMREFSTVKEPGPYYANYVRKHAVTDIPNQDLAKYVYEGLKDYNYKRTFLQSIEDNTNPDLIQKLLSFSYADLVHLKRRTTTYHDEDGYHRSHVSKLEYFDFGNGKSGYMSNSYRPAAELAYKSVPLTGMLTTIVYPTNGSTRFTFKTDSGIKLQLIEDFDEHNVQVRAREFEYNDKGSLSVPIFISYHDFYVQREPGWMKYMVESSTPQNDSYIRTHGVKSGNYSTVVYHGRKSDNNGFEQFYFSHARDTSYQDKLSYVYAIPADSTEGRLPHHIYPFPKNWERDYLRGLLLRHTVFTKGGIKPVSETIFEYDINPYGNKPLVIKGFKGGSFFWTTKNTTSFWLGSEVDGVPKYRYAYYKITNDWIVLKRKREIIYSDQETANKIENITDFAYDPVFLQQIETKQYLAADPGKKMIHRTRYATHADYLFKQNCENEFIACNNYCNYSDPTNLCYQKCNDQIITCNNYFGSEESAALQFLRIKNQIVLPVEVQKIVSENNVLKLISSIVYKYARIGANLVVKPKEVWEFKQSLNASDFKSSYITDAGDLSIDPRMRKVHSFDAYDLSTIKLIRQTTLDGTVSDYEWGYNSSLLTANTINSGLSQQKKTFTHKPLIGLLTITDENGIKNSYAYDKNGRLIGVRNHAGMQVTNYFYHNLNDTYKETLTASLKVSGTQLVGEKLYFETPLERRSYGEIDYSWNFGAPVIFPQSQNHAEYTYSSPGKYTVTVTKSHPEFGKATASTVINIYSERKSVVCVDGMYKVYATGGMKPELGDCTTQFSATTLRASYQGLCGPLSGLSYKWEVLDSSGNWITFGTPSSATTAPQGFVNKVPGVYKIRCTITDSCGFQAISAIKELSVI
jgi:YD repeat-containing protein